jgi:hypothetical protein
MIGKLLGHEQVQTTARYALLADGPVHVGGARTAAGIIAAFAALNGAPNRDE